MGCRELSFAMWGVLASGGIAFAGPVSINNGVIGAGQVDIEPDDYGAFGNLISMNQNDEYQPAGEQLRNVSYTAGAMVFVTTPDNKKTAVLLTDARNWINIIEPPANGDGVAGDHALSRMIMTANAPVSANQTKSEFLIQEANGAGPIKLRFALTQTLTATADGGRLEQTYAITNIGTTDVSLAFHGTWDTALIWGNSTFEDDVIGVGPNLCFIFEHDPGSTIRSVAFTDGGSTVPVTYYHAGKNGFDPPGGPAYTTDSLPIWTNRELPTSWRDHLSVVGYNTPGDTGTAIGDTQEGLEYHFPLAINASVTIKLHRYYGTVSPTCVPQTGANCGNNVTDAGEQCDSGGIETPTCNANCTTARCGDGIVNTAANEECDDGGADSPGCNAMNCTIARCGDGYMNAAAGETCETDHDTAQCNASNCQPPVCGDGYVNVAAGEQCDETSSYCDMTSCAYTFSIGGGCAGCGAGGGVAWPCALLFLLVRRRRR